MAWSSALLSANESNWAADDKPMLSSNALQAASVGDMDAKWVTGTTSGTWASADDTNASYPVENLWDGFPGFDSRATTASANWTLVFNASAAPIEFDWFGIINHNLKGAIVVVDVADDSAFTTNNSVIFLGSIPSAYTDRRWCDLAFGPGPTATAQRFSDVPWIRFAFAISSNVPYIGQFVFGRRRQQQFQPIVPWDPTNQVSSMDEVVGLNGVRDRSARYKARREMNAVFRHSDATLQSDTLALWSAIRHGSDPFYIHDEPSSNEDSFNMMMFREPELRYPWSGPKSRDMFIDAVEQGPKFFSQDVEA